MKRSISIFKILTFLSFIFLMIPNEKIAMPMIMYLFAMLIGYAGSTWILPAAIILIAAIFIFINAFIYSRLHCQISIVSILILYVPVGIIMNGLFHNNILFHYYPLSFL